VGDVIDTTESFTDVSKPIKTSEQPAKNEVPTDSVATAAASEDI